MSPSPNSARTPPGPAAPSRRRAFSSGWCAATISKLNYYHGQPCQLFDLDADPRELNDLAADLAYDETLATLKAEILAGWDPDAIAARMAQLRADAPILAGWGRNVQPPDCIRWNLKPEMDYLDEQQI